MDVVEADAESFSPSSPYLVLYREPVASQPSNAAPAILVQVGLLATGTVTGVLSAPLLYRRTGLGGLFLLVKEAVGRSLCLAAANTLSLVA